MTILSSDVIILGGGCGGLWLLYELAQRGISATLVADGGLGGYAATRNQSWLHSGAVFALINPYNTAMVSSCQESSSLLRSFCEANGCSSALSGPGALFLFRNQQKAVLGVERANNLSLTSPGHSGLICREQIESIEPGLALAEGFNWGLHTIDLTFDSHSLLTAIAARAIQKGGNIIDSQIPLVNMSVTRVRGIWTITTDSKTLRSPILICATGALIPQMARKLSPNLQMPFNVTRCVVCVIHKRICDRIISFQDRVANLLTLVPFGSYTIAGMPLKDTSSSIALNEPYNTELAVAQFQETFSLFLPSMTLGVNIHTYTCYTLNNPQGSSHDVRKYGLWYYFWLEANRKQLYYYYPGRFTLSPLAARTFADRLFSGTDSHSFSKTVRPAFDSDQLIVARQPYNLPAMHRL